MVKPKEVVSQRELVYRYRILLDEAMWVPPDRRRTVRSSRSTQHILQLVKENPGSTASKHVMWNIGKSRRGWLLAFLEKEYPEWRTPREQQRSTD